MTLDELLDAVRGLGRAFRLDGDRLVLTAGETTSVPGEVALSIREHKPAIVAMLRSPLVAHAMQTFGTDKASPISAGEYQSLGFEIAESVSRSRWGKLQSRASASTSTAASDGGAEA